MSAFDDLKRANKKTYQQIMYEILNLTSDVAKPVLKISEEIKTKLALKSEKWGINKDYCTLGLNIGVGEKWPSKAWPSYRWKELIDLLKREPFNLLLLGGTEEKDTMQKLLNDFDCLIDTGFNNSLMQFAAIIYDCDIIITADTLALHIATALEKKIIALFGPTSADEIELYGKGVKMISPKECNCYYKRFCTESVPCLNEISAYDVLKVIKSFCN